MKGRLRTNLRMVSASLAIALLSVACVSQAPTLQQWEQKVWIPIQLGVPSPIQATPEVCQANLVDLRSQLTDDSVAPNPELQEAFEKWSEAAQSITFNCASEAEDFTYEDTYPEVIRLGEQVDRILSDLRENQP